MAHDADQPTRLLLGRLWRDHIRKYVGRLALAIVCMVAVAASTAAIAIVMKFVVDDIFVDRDRTMLVVVAVVIFVIFFTKGVATFVQSLLMNYVGHRTIADIQVRMFDHLMGSDLAYFQANHTGQLISRLTNDVNRLRGAASSVVVN
ncbi:MAG: ABC transporter transmembrane domain-containing protein, partial [Alphaproteobacteria bacterium]|nr:ABC transporter transmembrane domain-containing protein [Alphaproteobacteria bacterium]